MIQIETPATPVRLIHGSPKEIVHMDELCRVVIPKKLRQRLGLEPGTAFEVVADMFAGMDCIMIAPIRRAAQAE